MKPEDLPKEVHDTVERARDKKQRPHGLDLGKDLKHLGRRVAPENRRLIVEATVRLWLETPEGKAAKARAPEDGARGMSDDDIARHLAAEVVADLESEDRALGPGTGAPDACGASPRAEPPAKP